MMNARDKGQVIMAQVVVVFGTLLILPPLWGSTWGWAYLSLLVIIETIIVSWFVWWRKKE